MPLFAAPTLPVLTAADFAPLLPAIILVVGASLMLMTEVFLKGTSRGYQAPLAIVFSAVAGWFALENAFSPARSIMEGFGVMDPFSSAITVTVCLGLILVLLLTPGFLQARNAERGEFYALLLFSASGMSLFALANELIFLFINLEIMSVAVYALAAFLRRGPRPAEAAFKYFILGSFASAILLYGIALLFGAGGSTFLSELSQTLPVAAETQPGLVLAGTLLLAGGFAFKVAAVPFHAWTPDVYEGSPTPVTAFMSAAIKAAAFAGLVRVFVAIAPGVGNETLILLFSGLALLTMVGGNLMALPQRNVKRMLAYSSIAHAGYTLVGVAALFVSGPGGGEAAFSILGNTPMLAEGVTAEAAREDALRAILFYLVAYTVTTIGTFVVLAAIERREEDRRGLAWDLERFAGLAERRPGWAIAMTVLLLSLGGIPPTMGFIGKLFIFRAAVNAGLVGLAIVGVLAAAAGIYYYLRVVVYMYMRPSPEGEPGLPRIPFGTQAALVLTTLLVVLWGVFPGSLSDWLGQASQLWMGQ
ncbi:MAG TPA: NADH-quinone oxidoreductase subunit N [Myxococcaceae bacterium]|nr:NADH-quinone oxidoreductase subunit N [Myxococcaceae bacterium]